MRLWLMLQTNKKLELIWELSFAKFGWIKLNKFEKIFVRYQVTFLDDFFCQTPMYVNMYVIYTNGLQIYMNIVYVNIYTKYTMGN